MQYNFYNITHPSDNLSFPCDGHGNFEGDLPSGVYRVIAFNPDVEHVSFSGMDNYLTALATVSSVPKASRTSALLSQPGKVYALNLGDFTVSSGDTLYFEPVPEMLIRRIRIRFLLSAQLQSQILGIDGVIGGVYPSVRLYGFTPWMPPRFDISGSIVNFHAIPEGANWTTLLDLFGICDPDYGRVYTSILDLTLILIDGRRVAAQVDLTAQLSDIINQSGGVIPLTLSLELEVKAIGAGFSVDILPWDPDGGDDIDLY